MSSWCHIFAPFWHIPTWFVCMCCNNALIMGSVVHKCVYDVCVCVSCMTLRRLLLVTPIWMIPTPLGDLFRPFIFPPPRSRELRSGAKWPVSTDTVPKRVPLRRAAAPGAGRQRRRDPVSRLVLQPFLPLHAQVFPTRAQRWRRPRYHVGTNLDINFFFFYIDAARTGARGNSGRSTPSCYGEEGWHESTLKTTIRAENEVEAHREANNYKVSSS